MGLAANDHVLFDGSNISAEATSPYAFALPPTMSTLPSSRSVAVCPHLGDDMSGTAVVSAASSPPPEQPTANMVHIKTEFIDTFPRYPLNVMAKTPNKEISHHP